MYNTVEIFQITYDNVKLLIPSLNDIKCLLKENKNLLDMLLLNQLDVRSILVLENCKMHKIALQNRLVEVQL